MKACSPLCGEKASAFRRSTIVPIACCRIAHAGSRGPGCCSRPRGTLESVPRPRGWWATSPLMCRRVGPSDAASRGSGRSHGEGVSPRKSDHGLRTWSQTVFSQPPRRSDAAQKNRLKTDFVGLAPLLRQAPSHTDWISSQNCFGAGDVLSSTHCGTLMQSTPRCIRAWTCDTRSGSSLCLRWQGIFSS